MTQHKVIRNLSSFKHDFASLVQVLFLLFCSFQTDAQRFTGAEAITIDDGLSFRNVTAITQDSRGLMWFGTQQGICRYDGYRFVVFSNKPGAHFPFPADRVLDNSLFFMPDSFLLVIADHQLFRINIVDYAVENLSESLGINGIVNYIQVAEDGKVWLSWDDETDQFLGYSDQEQLIYVACVPKLRREFTSLAIDKKGNAWWSTVSKGIRTYTPEGNLLQEMVPDSFVWFGTKMFFNPLFFDRDDQLFIFPKSKNQIWTFNESSKTVNVFSTAINDRAYHFLQDSQGAYWFGTKRGLYRYHNGTWSDFSASLNSVLQFTELHGIFEDKANELWIATDNGILKMPIYKDLFDNYLLVPNHQWGNAIRGIFEDKDGSVYFKCEAGSEKGISKFNPSEKSIQKCSITSDFLADTLLLDRAKHFVVDTSENIAWTIADDLMKLHLDNLELEVVASLSGLCNSFSHNPFILLDGGDLLLGSTVGALSVYDVCSGKFKKIPSQKLSEYNEVDTECFLQSADGNIWVGTASKGLLKISLQGELIAHYDKETTPPLSNNHVLSIHQSNDGMLWAGTFGGGLNMLNGAGGAITVFNSNNGLANDNVTGILEDNSGNVWVSTYNGISVLKRENNLILNYYKEDGLTNNEFNYASQYKSSDGILWFGGVNGVNAIDPSVVSNNNNNKNPDLVLTAIETHGSSYQASFLESDVGRLVVQPSYNYFQFSWTLPNYFKTSKNNYYVWMDGLDKNWAYLGSSNSIRYNKLPPGNYTFKVKGADSKGVWGTNGFSIDVQIKPHFYQTWWFVYSIALLLMVAVYSMGRYRLQKLLEMERMRTRIASDLHDEVGSMLSGLAMQAELMEMNPKQNHASSLAYLRKTSREAVSKMRDLVWSIDSRRDLVKNLLDRMREYAEEVLPAKNIQYDFRLGELDLNQKLPSQTRQHLYFIFKEAVNNVVRHSNADHVEVVFGNFGDEFKLEICDNGNVPSEKFPATGLGISNIRMRANKLNAKLSIGVTDGFCILLSLPKF